MYDGAIRFNTKIDNSQVDKDLRAAQRKIQKAQEDITKHKTAKLPLVADAEKLNKELTEAKANLKMLEDDLAAAQSAMMPGASLEDYLQAYEVVPQLEQAVKAQQAEIAKLESSWEKVSGKVDEYDLKIHNAENDIAANTEKANELAAQLQSGGAKMAAAMDKAHASANKFGRRLLEIGKSALIFNVISSGLRAVVNYMGKALKTNDEYNAALARLKGALLTAFQPIYEFVLPGLIAVLNILTAIVQVVANALSFLTGKTASQSAKNAKALYEEAEAIGAVGGAAKDAQKSLANFDEINTLGSPETESGGGGGATAGNVTPNFEDFNTDEYKARIDELTVYLSGALLALGAILAFSGANIPLGIGLMAAGAIGLAKTAKLNWDSTNKSVKGALTKVLTLVGTAFLAVGAILAFSGGSVAKGIALMAIGAASLAGSAALNWNTIKNALQGPIGQVVAIVSVAFLALGAILAFTGVNLPLGIALIAVGAAALATVAYLNWDTIVSALQGPLGETVALASGALLALGVILAFSGVALPLGIALIVAGAAGLVTVSALNWNAIQDKLKETWAGIKQWFNTNVAPKLTLSYWKEKFANIASGLSQKIRDGVNAGIALFNSFISWVNSKMKLSWGDFNFMGKKVISAGSFQLLNIPSIPYLAQGAVIPPNAPFMAVLGDQKHGTNIEAPLETIKQALAEVLALQGRGDINITFTGDLAQLGRVLKPVIDTENRRVGDSFIVGVTG